MGTKVDYTKYITGAHRDKPKFVETVALTAGAINAVSETLLSLIDAHFIDTAVGKQLDTLGEWIGQSRYIKEPLDDVYFTWDKNIDTGWESGLIWDTYSPMSGITRLDDGSYRYLLKMFIAVNHWRGNINDAYDIWQATFGNDNFVIITDHQDMSIDIGFSGQLPAPVKAMIRAGIQPFKPEGVRVNTYFVNGGNGPMFGWDIANDAINGWELGYWPQVIDMD